MRRLSSVLLALTLCVAFSVPAQAQDLRLGGEAGMNVASLGGDTEGLDSRTAFSIGGVLRYDPGPGVFGIQSGLIYAQKGAEEQGTLGGESFQIDYKLAYLQVPLLATINIPVRGSSVNPRLVAGPALNLELDCSIGASLDEGSSEVDCGSSDLGLETTSLDLGLLFGGGIDLGLGPGQLTLDTRYDLGLTNINDVPEASEVSIKNRNWQITAGYLFGV